MEVKIRRRRSSGSRILNKQHSGACFETETSNFFTFFKKNETCYLMRFHFFLLTITYKLDELKTKEWKLTSAQTQRFEELCECRMARMPIQYIIGEWDFRDLTLEMKPPVFIPRPETEELVELILQQFDSKRAMRFMEIGCGSGAISLALLKSLPKVYDESCDEVHISSNCLFLGFAGSLCCLRSKSIGL